MGRTYALLVIAVLAALCCAYPNQASSIGRRTVTVFNLLPITYEGLVEIDLNFAFGEAYNGTIGLISSEGSRIPLQVVGCRYYPNSSYYESCRLAFPVRIDPLNSTKVTVEYSSLPAPAAETPAPGALRVFWGNLTLPVYNLTGVYELNLTRVLVVESPEYTFVFSNSSLIHARFKGYSQRSIVFADWSLPGFAMTGPRLVSPYDAGECRVSLAENGTLRAAVTRSCAGGDLRVEQHFHFTAYPPVVQVTTTISASGRYTLYIPFLRAPIPASALNITVGNVTLTADKPRTITSPPSWLVVSGEGGGILVSVNFSTTRLDSVFGLLASSYLRQVTGARDPAARKLNQELYTLALNISSLYTPGIDAPALEKALKSLRERDQLYLILLSNLTEIFERPALVKRLLVLPEDNGLGIAYQLNGTFSGISSTVTIAPLAEDPASRVRNYVLSEVVKPVVFYAPTAAILETPTSVTLDEAFEVKARIYAARRASNLTVTIAYPAENLLKVGGELPLKLRQLEGEISLSWVFQAVREGYVELVLNVTSNEGSLLVSRMVNITIPQITPVTRAARRFNVTVLCMDSNGKPLGGYLVNLYDNATGALVYNTVTSANGSARIHNVSAGAYILEVTDGLHYYSRVFRIYSNMSITVAVMQAELAVRVQLDDGSPLPLALIQVRDLNGSLACNAFTNASGFAVCRGLAGGEYTVSVLWNGMVATHTRLQILNNTVLNLRGVVKKVVVSVLLGSQPTPNAIVNVYSSTGVRVYSSRTDENGQVEVFLLPGIYRVVVTKGQYRGEEMVDVRSSSMVVISLYVSSSLWLVMASTAALWGVTGFVWRRKTSFVAKERERYRRLLRRLEELHDRGEVEDRYYYKLKQEYEEKLNELSRGWLE